MDRRRSRGVVVLSALFVTYGLATIGASLYGAAVTTVPSPLVPLVLAIALGVLATLTGFLLWHLSPRTSAVLVSWAIALAAFNAIMLFLPHPELAIPMAGGGLAVLVLLVVLYRYIDRVCRPTVSRNRAVDSR